jgi:undecaprenyl-diphosphatase
MNGFDAAILSFLNRFARRSEIFDELVAMVAYNDLLKGAIAVTVLYGLWFANPGDEERQRRWRAVILATLAGVVIALALNRYLASQLPFRIRPVTDPESGFSAPFGIGHRTFSNLSSFPSDHAVMFIGLATGALLISRLAGTLLLAHALLIVLPSRLYLGLHFPTDMLAGGLLGAALVMLTTRSAPRQWISRPFLRWSEIRPASFYALFFLATLELAILFQGMVAIGYFLQRWA